MREFFNYNLKTFEPLLNAGIMGFYFVENAGMNNPVRYLPYSQQFDNISNLVIWYVKNGIHCTVRLCCVDNGVFLLKDNEGKVHSNLFGIRSIQAKSNEDLFYGKRGSISLKDNSGLYIDGIEGVINKIIFYQEVLKEYDGFDMKNAQPDLLNNTYFPDKIIFETFSSYFVVRAEEDYDQNLFLKCKVGMKSEGDVYYSLGYDDMEGYNCIELDVLLL